MTKNELITRVQEEKPNTFGDSKLLQYLNDVEAEVAEQLKVNFVPYEDVQTDYTLLAQDPYSRLYVSYLKAQIDYAHEEYPSYQLNAEQHVQDFRDFVDFVVRTRKTDGRNYFPRRILHVL